MNETREHERSERRRSVSHGAVGTPRLGNIGLHVRRITGPGYIVGFEISLAPGKRGTRARSPEAPTGAEGAGDEGSERAGATDDTRRSSSAAMTAMSGELDTDDNERSASDVNAEGDEMSASDADADLDDEISALDADAEDDEISVSDANAEDGEISALDADAEDGEISALDADAEDGEISALDADAEDDEMSALDADAEDGELSALDRGGGELEGAGDARSDDARSDDEMTDDQLASDELDDAGGELLLDGEDAPPPSPRRVARTTAAAGIGTGVQAARAPAPHAMRPQIRLADVRPGKANRSVLLVQQALKKAVTLDYSSGPGHFGPRTKAAYERWQRKCGVGHPTGTPDLLTLRKLGERYGFSVVRGPAPEPPTPTRGRMPLATWRPIRVNHTPNGQEAVRGVVIHIMDGTLAGTDSWFRNPTAQASAHFGTGKHGQLYQWVSTKDRAWAQANGNRTWLSIENEGRGGDALTRQQIERCAQVLAWAHRTYGVPLQVATSPGGRGLGHHSMGGPSWGHGACPGPRIIRQKPAIVARARQLVGARAPVRPPAPPPASHAHN
jgi:peptidoglycan hydrolase-like protein with peptidoglycan-binding domain